MTAQNIGNEGVRWFVAKVEDINDPEMLGRVKIRVFNEHSETNLSVDDLHWATPIVPITYASLQQVGRSPTGLLVGSYVFGFFLDGNEKQMPLLWGSYHKIPDKDQNKNDVTALAREKNTIKKTPLGPEPGSAYKAKYPWNHVWQTKSGHVFEVDDTPGHERIHNYHRTGTYEEINEEGRKVQKIVNDNIEVVVKDKIVYVKGDCNIHIVGDYSLQVDGQIDINCNKGINITAKDDIIIKGKNIYLNE